MGYSNSCKFLQGKKRKETVTNKGEFKIIKLSTSKCDKHEITLIDIHENNIDWHNNPPFKNNCWFL